MVSLLAKIFDKSSAPHVYSKEFEPAKPGQSAVYRAPASFEGLKVTPDGECYTMQDVFLRAARVYPDKPYLGTVDSTANKYNWKTLTSIKELSTNLGTNMNRLQLSNKIPNGEAKPLDVVGIFSKNREEWLILEYANFLYGRTMVPLYDTLGPESISFILEQTGLETVFISGEAVVQLLKNTTQIGKLKNVVLFDNIEEEKIAALKERKLNVFYYSELIDRDVPIDPYAKVEPEDIATFSYTSGTTGQPKGALISHKNFVGVIAIAVEENFSSNDVYLSYLPLPHILERIASSTFLYFGAQVGLYRGDIKLLKEDLALLKPTIFASVPRVYNRFFEAIKEKFRAATGFQAWLLNKALETKLENSVKGQFTHAIWDRLIFNKVKSALGGRVRYAVVGGAPISSEVLTFMRSALSIPILEGYGQTETAGASFSTSEKDGTTGHVGGPRGHMEFKLVDIPEMGYTANDLDEKGNPQPRGEICSRGNGIFSGYYLQPKETAEILDEEGWLHSGDVGRIDPIRGCVTIIDRKKNIFKIAIGEYIAPDKIENIYLRAKGVEEVFVYGDSLQATLVSIVVPSKDFLKAFAEQNGLEFNVEELCNNLKVKGEILKNMFALGKKEGLLTFEQAKSVFLFPESLQTIDCLTNTLKIKRKQCRDYFRQQIDIMYAEQIEPKQ